MRHVSLTCRNHPQLRWSCKSIAFTEGYGYNGERSIFYKGTIKLKDGEPVLYFDKSGVECVEGEPECTCPPTDLIRAPEDMMLA